VLACSVVQRLLWLGFPLAVMRKFRDDNGGPLTTVVADNAFFAVFPVPLVVVTMFGCLLGRDSAPAAPAGLGDGRVPSSATSATFLRSGS
jgi:hypothetical protein